MADTFLYLGSKLFSLFPVLGNIVRFIYLRLVFPVYFLAIAKLTRTDFKIVYRHSVLNKNFNPFLSDIDYNLILLRGDEASLDHLVDLLGKHRLRCLDIPQVYLPEEFAASPSIDDKNMWFVRLIWYCRKQRWINLKNPTGRYEKLKKELANNSIQRELLKDTTLMFHFKAEDLKIDFPFAAGPELCLYSPYLEFVDQTRTLTCSLNQLEFIFSLLPGEEITYPLTDEQKEFKKQLWRFEYCVSRSHYRVHSRLGEDCSKFPEVLRRLEKKYVEIFNESLPNSGKENDLYF